jgi:hypothetical protein
VGRPSALGIRPTALGLSLALAENTISLRFEILITEAILNMENGSSRQ